MHGSHMAIHRTVLRTYQLEINSCDTQTNSNRDYGLATLDSSQQEALLQPTSTSDVYGLTSTQPDQPNDESVKIPSAQEKLINSQHEAINIKVQCRDIYILYSIYCFSAVGYG